MSRNGTFKVGGCLVEPGLDRISRGSETITVRPQVMDVLVYLASKGGQTVHADELLEDLWPGKVVTSASVYNCITELRHAFQDCDDGQPYVDTIPKKGYRLVAPVTGLKASKVDARQNGASLLSRRMAFIVITLLAAAAFLFAYQKWWVSEPPTQSIAVLPFENISPDPGDAYFADGICEEITAQLGMIQSLTVTSRNSARHYIPGTAPTRQIATDLGVNFLLEGSARKDRSRTRITVQLIDARTDEHLWAEVYDRDLSAASLFDIQADIAGQVASALRVRISSVERGRISGRSTESRVAYDLYLRANQVDWDARSADAVAELLKQALSFDPGFADARATLALLYARRSFFHGHSLEWAASGLALARQAIDDDPNLPSAHYALAENLSELGRLTEAVRAYEKALELRPSDGTAYASLSLAQEIRGRLDEAVDLNRRGFRIDPRNPNITLNSATFEMYFGNYRNVDRWLQASEALSPEHPYLSVNRVILLLAEGKTQEAIEEAERHLYDNPDFVEAYAWAADAWLRAGNYEQARRYLEELHAIAPKDWDIYGRTHRTLYGWVLLKLGDTERGLALLEEVLEEARRLIDQGNEFPGLRREIAAVYAATGNRQRAYEWLERAIDSGWRLERMYPSPLFESLRGEERFQQLMDRIDADLERMKDRIVQESLAPPLEWNTANQ